MTLAWLGVGLLLMAPVHPARARLTALVGGRLPSPATEPPSIARFSFRFLVITTAVAVGGVTLIAAGPVPGMLAAAGVVTAGWVWPALRAERAAATDEARLIALVSAIAAEQAAGAGLAAALRQAAPEAGRWQPALIRAARTASNGGDPAAGLSHEPLLIPVAVALAVASRTGAALTEVLARVRGELCARQECRRAVA